MESRKVTVLTPNGRRQNVPISPSTTMLQILEEVCKKHGFSSDEYGLQHHNKEVDLSLMFRFTGFPNNCLLEMVKSTKLRKESDVVLCAQFEDGSRCTGSFQPNDTFSDILIRLCPEKMSSINHPVVVYMRKEIYGDELSRTSLKSLGITSGRAIIRLINKNPEELKNQANVYIETNKAPLKELDKSPEKKKISSGANSQSFQITTDVLKTLKGSNDTEKEYEKKSEDTNEEPVTKKLEYDWGTGGRTVNEKLSEKVEEKPESQDIEMQEPEINEIGDRNAVLFSLQAIQKESDDIPDSFFDLTVDDIKLIIRDLRKEASGNEDAPLLTSKLRNMEENVRTLKKLSQYKTSVIRIQFPDRYVLQGTFAPYEKLETVYEFVQKYLKDDNIDFHLFTIPPKRIPEREKTLLELDFVPTAILLFGVDNITKNNECFLKQEILSKVSSPSGAVMSASKSRGLFPTSELKISAKPEGKEEDVKQQATNPSNLPGTSGNIPKWFKPIKK